MKNEEFSTAQKYADIIDLPHYEPKHHPRMPMMARAAQFAPFAALTGYNEAIDETTQRNAEEMGTQGCHITFI